MIQIDPISANSLEKDRTFIRLIIIIKYGLSVAKLVFIIMTVCYFLGMLWQVITIEIYHHSHEEFEKLDPKKYNTESFITTNDMIPETS